ncbi:hypothetical protein, conserved [Leishmania tarentolae]|uniref:Uncharacterized protein n=1 Tax=Leishmania tarentolae TaxID=5689 RepID=A0A640K8Z6_LEITA|nr:hypothetical protein, conserved [Leishmania tarentolae]
MAFTASSLPLSARPTGVPALCKATSDEEDKDGTEGSFTAACRSSRPPSCSSTIKRIVGQPLACLPSQLSHNANPPRRSDLGVGARLRYGTDPMTCSDTTQLSCDASAEDCPSSLVCTVPHGSSDHSSALGKDYTLYAKEAGGSPHDAPMARRCSLSPIAAAAVARTGMPAAQVLLRHSHGGKTRLLYADGHVETIVGGGATKLPPKRPPVPRMVSHRRGCADDKRSHASASALQATTREKEAHPPSPSANGRWLLESFNAVAQVHQQQLLPPLVEPIGTPKGVGVASPASPPLHSVERSSVWPVEVNSSQQVTKLPSRSFVAVEPQSSLLLPQQQQVAASMAPVHPSGETLPQQSGDFKDGTENADGLRESAEATGDEGVGGRIDAFCAMMPARPPPSTTALVQPSRNTSSAGEATFSKAADDAKATVSAMQFSIRAELSAERRAGVQAFANRYARDVYASPSLFSLRFPVRALSELCQLADRRDREEAAPSRRGLSREEPSASFLEHQGATSATKGAGEASVASPTRAPLPQQQTPDVLLPHAQTTTPSGFTVPELLQDCLLPRETPALQGKLRKLYAVRGLIDACDSAACRFTVSFMWFVLLRCRKARREQSLVDGYRHLSHAFFDTFPHVARDEMLPPLDVLEQLLVELLTCVRYSVEVQSVTNTAAIPAAASNAVSASRRGEEFPATDGLGTLARTSSKATSSNKLHSSVAPPSRPASAPPKTNDTLNAASVATAALRLPLRLQLSEHSACFPLLLSPTWSKLVHTNAADASSGDSDQEPTYAQQHEQPRHARGGAGRRMLPSDDALATLRKVCQDLWLHHSEYVQLCLYEALMQQQLTLQFRALAMHLQQGVTSAEASTAAPTTAPFSASVSRSLPPSVTRISCAVADTTPNALGEGLEGLRASQSVAPTLGGDTQTSKSRSTATMSTSTAVAAAATAAPAALDDILESLLLLVAHATYYNCAFCFPNDVCAGMFNEEFRTDMVRLLSCFSQGVCLTHAQVRHWPMPVKDDYADVQLKRKAAMELEILALGLLPACEQKTTGTLPAADVSGMQSKSPLTSTDEAARTASPVAAAENGIVDVGDVAANSEARLVYQLDRYGRSALLHVAELERSMALLQQRHLEHDKRGSYNSQSGLRGANGSTRTPANSRRGSSVASVAPAPSPLHVGPNLSEVKETEASSSCFTARRQTGMKASWQKRCDNVGFSRKTTNDSPATEAAPAQQSAAVDARGCSRRSRLQQAIFPRNGGGMQSLRQRRTRALLTPPLSHGDREEEARAQYRTTEAVVARRSLVSLASELSHGNRVSGAEETAWKTNSMQATCQESEQKASASVCDAQSGSANVGGHTTSPAGCAAASQKRSSELPPTGVRADRRELSTGSLLSSHPLCISPQPIRDYWLSMLLRAPFWWTTRRAMSSTSAETGAGVVASPVTLPQESAQLVLWSSVPIGADGQMVPLQELCRLQLEPWRALFTAVTVLPASKELQQAAHQIRIYSKTMPLQQARLYRMAELQKSHHQDSRPRRPQEHNPELSVLVSSRLASVVDAAKTTAMPNKLVPSAAATTELQESTVEVITPRAQCLSGRWRHGSSVEGTEDGVCMCSAMLPLTPLSIPECKAALDASTATAMSVAARAPTVSQPHSHDNGETDNGCMSPFSEGRLPSFMQASSHPFSTHAHRKGSERIQWDAQHHQVRLSNAWSRNSYSDLTDMTTPDMAATPIGSTLWGLMPNSDPVPPTLAHRHSRTQVHQALTPHGTLMLSTSSVFPADAGTKNRTPSREGPLSRSCGGRSDDTTRKTMGTPHRQGKSFSTTAVPRKEAKLRWRRLAPLKTEALRRRAQLLGDLNTISKRDQVVRQHYTVQHLQLSNAMTYTQSEAMMRRYRAQSRLALERLICSEVGDAAAARTVTERTKDFNL